MQQAYRERGRKREKRERERERERRGSSFSATTGNKVSNLNRIKRSKRDHRRALLEYFSDNLSSRQGGNG